MQDVWKKAISKKTTVANQNRKEIWHVGKYMSISNLQIMLITIVSFAAVIGDVTQRFSPEALRDDPNTLYRGNGTKDSEFDHE